MPRADGRESQFILVDVPKVKMVSHRVVMSHTIWCAAPGGVERTVYFGNKWKIVAVSSGTGSGASKWTRNFFTRATSRDGNRSKAMMALLSYRRRLFELGERLTC
jgi:hypothetical protein